MTKKDIRKLQLIKRQSLSLQEVADFSLGILHNFRRAELLVPQILLSYSPMPETNEFNVVICEDLLQNLNPDLRILWPKIAMETLSMQAHVVDSNRSFIKNRFNILEPVDGDIIPPVSIDMVFVPLLAFDEKGYRVGYGKGFYDRYLPRCKPDVIKVGFSFFDALPAISDINEFDVPLNLCFTPTRIYEF